MKFEVYDRVSIRHIKPTVPHIVISISDTPGRKATVATNDLTLDVLYLSFHDIDKPIEDHVCFDKQFANQVLDFYLKYKDKASLCVAHCNAGQSRSPGVLAALQKIDQGNDGQFFTFKTPNRLAYSTILNTGADRGLI